MRKIPNTIILMVVTIIASSVLIVTYATGNTDSPDLIITINEDHQYTTEGNQLITQGENGITVEGNIFSNSELDVFDGHFFDGKWYPGKEKSGVIRIVNNYRDGDVTIGGLNVDIFDFKEEFTKTEVETSFLKYMVLTIETNGSTIVNKAPLSDINLNGIAANQFSVPAGSSIDLEYKLLMHEDAGNELQSIKAAIDFLISVDGDEVANDRGSNNHHNNDNNNSAEPDTEVTPLLPIVIEKVGLSEERFLKIEFPPPKEDDGKITEERNVGLKIIKMVEDEEQVIASCILGEGNDYLNLNEAHYLVNFNVKDQQFEPNVTYTAYVYDIDTGEKLLEPVNFIVDTESVNQLFNKQI